MAIIEFLQHNVEAIGWVATSLFTVSFFVKTETSLLRAQMLAAALWMTYGLLIEKTPVIVANALVAAGSIYKQVMLVTRANRKRIVT
jgi:uncharacterized protein with PQ loop repeat